MNVTLEWLNRQFPDLSDFVPLGSGGQKIVFAVRHPDEGDIVLKLIHPHQDAEAVRREILAVNRVQSPRVPRILDTGRVLADLGECVWVREQRIKGVTLRQRLGSGPLEAREILRLGLHMLEALARAEEVRIVHRDVKPDNIMQDADGAYWLLDFGVARHLTLDSLTATAAPLGKCTPGYAPPEQFKNYKTDIDARSDLFALGVTLHECATGRNPFLAAGNMLATLHNVEKRPLPPLDLGMASGPGLRDLISAMTQKRRDHRPDTAGEALEWMRELCQEEGVTP